MNDIKTLTVFTPTFNRASLLINCYDSLKRQMCKDFKWLIIDDGSTDNTESVVKQWINENNGFEIIYVKKENGGLASTYNEAISLCDTELFVCVDSDDYLSGNAVELMLNYMSNNDSSYVCGMIGYNRKNNIDIIGKFPNIKSLHLSSLVTEYKFKGDFKAVYKTKVLKKYFPIPIYDQEKYMNPVYLMFLIDKDYEILVSDIVLCIVNYQKDGLSANIINQYYDSPKSFLELRKMYLSFKDASLLFKFKHSIHYVSSAILCKDLNALLLLIKSNYYSLLAIIPGICLSIIIRIHHYIYKLLIQRF